MADISDLKSRYGSEENIPERLRDAVTKIYDHLQKQPDKVLSVRATFNFDKDVDSSLFHEKNIYKGLVVALKGDYVMSEADAAWFHPDMYKCRGVYEHGDSSMMHADAGDKLGSMNCSAGVYAIRYQDALGEVREDLSTIVDTYKPVTASTNKVQLRGKTIAQLFSGKQRSETLAYADHIAKNLGAGERTQYCFINNLMRGGDNQYFYFNGNIRGSQALVLVSPLKGYKLVKSGSDDYVFPADIIDESKLIPFGQLSSEDQLSVYRRVSWSTPDLVNTYMLKMPLTNFDFKDAEHYQMVKVVLSHQPITESMPPSQLYEITPPIQNIPDTQVSNHFHWCRDDKVKLDASEENLQALIRIRNKLPVFNREVYDGELNQLTVPREWLKQIKTDRR